ncbi:hypothetical protein BM524_13210 [Alteromonas mediterranea]|uniref:Metallo-beta-lactamase domain-containing protein n=1 Tax=Alteromonas mediterranea TaxID=314275 RepID=A0AAC9JBW8_9ALTE|nr:MBL fold metallo-hydrolase [Alteromonas mediterranea]APD90681.1 hypothetical protein BM524_13210 [Alteromonas mediterranea]
MNIKILKANNGDSILLSWLYEGITKNVLIDGGKSNTYKQGSLKKDLFKALSSIKEKGQKIDLLVLTHVDDDHIGGLLKAFKHGELLRELCDKVWFNSGLLIDEYFNQDHDETHAVIFDRVASGTVSDNYTSIRQGVSFEETIAELGVWQREIIKAGQVHELWGAKFFIISPSEEKLEALLVKWGKEQPDSLTSGKQTDYTKTFEALLENDEFRGDSSIHNGSSIAFLLEIENKRLLMLGDAHDEVIVEEIKRLKDTNGQRYSENNPLKVNFVKLSHHGSQYNTSPEFLRLIDAENFIVSTDGSAHGLPDKLTIARIHQQFPNATIHFNYDNPRKHMFKRQERERLAQEGFKLKVIENELEL